MKFEFADELPPKASPGSEGDPLLDAFAAALKERPESWAKWPKPIPIRTAHTYTSQIHRGRLRSFRGGGFEATCRNGVLYVRYVGGMTDQ